MLKWRKFNQARVNGGSNYDSLNIFFQEFSIELVDTQALLGVIHERE